MIYIKNISICVVLFIAALLFAEKSYAQLVVNEGLSAADLAESIAGPGIQIFNPVITGASVAYGSYSTQNTNLPFGDGILLSTGKASYAIGPNNIQHRSYINSQPGSILLDTNLNQITNDACRFEFDIIPQGDTLRFDFTFASEEYHNFVGSVYSDVFAFYISGPGIDGYENLAIVPGTNDPVSINTVNLVNNSIYFIDNDNPAGTELQYNGYTTNLQAKKAVNPCDTYHLILVIADANDYSIDSGVFIEKIESSNASLSSATAGGIEYMVEGCNDGTINFSRLSDDLSEDITITFYVDGTAINGVDYLPQIGSDPNPFVPKTIDILAGESEASITVSPVDDGLINTNKYLALYLASTSCPSIIYDSLLFPIYDSLIVEIGPDTAICFGESLPLSSIEGGSTWLWSPSEFVQDPSAENTLATPDSTAYFVLYTTASFCEAYDSILVSVSDLELSIDSLKPTCFGLIDGFINSTPIGGIEPYQINWSGPDGFISDQFELSDLEAGTYSYILSDSIDCSISGEITLIENDAINVSLQSPLISTSIYNIACHGDSTGSIQSVVSGGQTPYQYIWSPDGQTTSSLVNMPAGNYSMLAFDANGCFALDTITLLEPPPFSLSLDSMLAISCYGESTGYLEVSAAGGVSPYTYIWNTNPPSNGNVLENLTAGQYELSVFDLASCQIDTSFQINEAISPLSLTLDSVVHVDCPNASNGSISVLVDGGTPPYSLSWNTLPIQTTTSISNLAPGIYELTCIDSLGCERFLSVEVSLLNQPLSASISSQNNVDCFGDSTGSAAISVTGGNGIYSYLWSPGNDTSSSVFNLLAGNYTVLINDSSSCSLTTSVLVSISEPSDSIEIQLSSSDFNGFGLSCFESGNGEINSNVIGGNPAYTYAWQSSNGFTSSNQNLANLEAGTYTLQVSDQNSCSAIDSITLTEPEEIAITYIMVPASCPTPGSNDGSIDITVTGGVSPYLFSWSGPAGFNSSNQNISNLIAGVYTLEIEDAINCIQSFSITVTQPDNFMVSEVLSSFPGAWNVDCYSANTGSIDVSVTNAAEPISYSWIYEGTEIATDTFISNAFAGEYELVITDANNCVENRFYTLTQPDSIIIHFDPNNDDYGNAISCFGGSDGVINTFITGGTPNYNYTWTFPDNTSASTPSIIDLSIGSYALFIEDQNGCIGSDSIEITQPDSIVISLYSPTTDGTNVTCFNGNDGTIITTVNGGTPPFNFQWIYPGGGIGSTDQNPSNLQEGTYILNLTDFHNCTATDTITLVASDPISYTALLSDYNGYNLPCAGDSIASASIQPAGGTAPYFVVWSNGDTSETQINLSAGYYSGIIVDSQNCIGNFNIEITEPNEITAQFDISSYSDQYQLQCFNDSSAYIYATINGGNPPYSINWTGPVGFTSNEDSITDLIAGDYMMVISDQNTCTKNYTITLNEPQLLDLSIAEINPLYCNGDSNASLLATSTGGVGIHTISWTGPNGFTSDQFYIEALIEGNYCAIVEDENGCSATACYTIIAPNQLSVSLSSPLINGVNIICNGDSSGSIYSLVTGGVSPYIYSWTGPIGSDPVGANPSNLIAGVYSLYITDSAGCVANENIELTEDIAMQSSFQLSDYSGFNVSCNSSSDGSIIVESSNGTLPYSYNWYYNMALISNNDTLTNLSQGEYILETSDANSCILKDSIVLSGPDSIGITLLSMEVYPGINISCANGSDGSIESLIIGGTGNYSYSWSGPSGYNSVDSSIFQLSAGWYSLTVVDDNLCTLSDSLELIDPDEELSVNGFVSTQNSGTNISCFGGSDGSIMLAIEDGIPNYQIYWLGPDGFSSNQDSISNLIAGVYFLSVVDSASCTYSEEFILNQPSDSLTVAVNFNDNVCYGDSIASIELIPSGGSPSYEISWQGPNGFLSNSFEVTGLLNGVYTYVLNDTNLCSTLDSITISSANEMLSNGTIQNLDCFAIDDGSIIMEMTGGGSNYNYSWTGPNGYSSNSDSIVDLEKGTYCVEVISDLNCLYDTCYTLSATDSLIVQDSIINPNCGYSNGSILLTISGGSSPYSINWGSSSGSDINDLGVGIYTAEITDSLNCYYEYNYELIGPDSLESNANVLEPLCSDSSGMISLSISGGTPQYDILWLGPDGFTSGQDQISDLDDGNYQLTLIDSLGCSLFEEYLIVSPASIETSYFIEVYDNGFNLSSHGFNDGLIEILSISGGSGEYTIQWNGPFDFESMEMTIANLYAGHYDLSILDENNCLFLDSIVLSEPASTILPTGFTPNNDGYNDQYIIPGNNALNQVSLKVYNRWGNLVYENSNYENEWDGSNKNGEALPEGTYFVIVEILELEQTLNGYVDLRR